MPSRKRSRDDEFVAAEAAPRGCPLLPAELHLEIVAHSDAATVVRCAASSRSLRREILHPAFIHRICCNDGGAVPPRLLGFLGLTTMPQGYNPMPPPSFSLAYPATRAAASLSDTHLAPFLSRDEDRLSSYATLMSRNGLVLLRHSRWVQEVTLCVYDAMTGKGTFFPGPPKANTGHGNGSYLSDDKFVLLTAADGVGCPFLVFAADFSRLWDGSRSIIVRTFSPPSDSDAGGEWSPATFASHCRPPQYANKQPCDNVAVLRGGLIHWLIRDDLQGYYIFTYNVLTAASGWIDLPAECRDVGKLHLLASSPPSGTRLSLLVVDKFKVSVWLLLSAADDEGAARWARQAVIDTERSASLKGVHPFWARTGVDIVGSGARCSAVILMWHSKYSRSWSELFEKAEKGLIVLDLETKAMREVSKKKDA